MKAFCSALSLIGLLTALPTSAAPKHIIISDSLLANAEKWDVKMAGQWMGIHKWRFGDYAVVASRLGPTTSSTKTNLLQTKTERRSVNTFSFVLSGRTGDSAFVTAAHGVMAQAQKGLDVGKGWSIGGEERTLESEQFTASIAINRDSTETWTLSIVGSGVANRHGDYREDLGTFAAHLSHGERNIVLAAVRSTKRGERESFAAKLTSQIVPPAMGYEFVEDGQSLCALEYFSSGLAGQHKNTIWMHRHVDPRLKLVLAAAMTAVLELMSGEAGPAQPDPD